MVSLDKPPETSDNSLEVTDKQAQDTVVSCKVLSTYRDTVSIDVDGLQDVISQDALTDVQEPRPPTALQGA